MKRNSLSFIAIVLVAAAIAGCSRTVEDVAKWETKGNTQKLTAALTDPKEEVRLAAAESLGKLKNESTVDALATCLNDESDSVVLASIDALAAIGGDKTLTPLVAALKLSNQNARLKAADALGSMKNAGAVEPLSGALLDKSEDVQCAAAKALAQIGSESGSEALASCLADEQTPTKVRIACADALAKTGGTAAYTALVNTLADQNDRVVETAKASLLRIGDPAIPSAIAALKNENIQIRKEAIALLRGLSAIPTKGADLVWYQLARATIDNTAQTDADMVSILTSKGSALIDPLLDACTLKTQDLRDKAELALEHIGEPCIAKAMHLVPTKGKNIANIWYDGRSNWVGAPSEYLDLWGALAAINPQFELNDETVSSLKTKGRDALRVLTDEEFEASRAYIPYIIQLLGDETCADMAKKNLLEAGNRAILPLIAATSSDNDAIANAAANLIMDRNDPRSLEPLMHAVKIRIDAGASLSEDPIYTALQKLNSLDAEPLILKVRPNTERALHLFTMQYHDVKVIGAETNDPYTSNEAPILFRIGYIQDGQPGSLEVTFKKDMNGDWQPSPSLPYKLP